MAGLLNVNRDVQDTFYRYKMPRLLAKVEGRGNGIKTVIPNMTEVAKALGRPAEYPTKYFGCELGAQTIMDATGDKYVVNGDHHVERLQELLHGFIRKFVLCPQCDNPETTLTVIYKSKKDAKIEQSCKACGHRNMLDMTHKLTTFIVNHPPSASVPEDKSKKEKKHDKKNAKSPKSDEPLDVPKLSNERDDDDEDWGEDTSESAVRERQKDLSVGVASMTMSDDLEKSKGERLDLFHAFFKKQTAGGAKADAKALVAEAERLDCKDKAVMVLVSEFWMCDDDQLLGKMKDSRPFLLPFTTKNHKAQKYLLGALEQLIERSPSLLAKVSSLLNRLYEDDLVEEEVFQSWGEKVSKKYVTKGLAEQIHEKAAKFLEWLKEADEESDEEDDDEEEEEEDVKPTSRGPSMTENKMPVKAVDSPSSIDEPPTPQDNGDDEEIDIDAI